MPLALGDILLVVMISFGLALATGWFIQSRIYARFGYPPIPAWARTIRLADDLDTVWHKARVALDDGYTLTRHDDTGLVLEKEFTEPPCLARFEAWRARGSGGGSGQKFSVRCPNHWWLYRSRSSWRNW